MDGLWCECRCLYCQAPEYRLFGWHERDWRQILGVAEVGVLERATPARPSSRHHIPVIQHCFPRNSGSGAAQVAAEPTRESAARHGERSQSLKDLNHRAENPSSLSHAVKRGSAAPDSRTLKHRLLRIPCSLSNHLNPTTLHPQAVNEHVQ